MNSLLLFYASLLFAVTHTQSLVISFGSTSIQVDSKLSEAVVVEDTPVKFKLGSPSASSFLVFTPLTLNYSSSYLDSNIPPKSFLFPSGGSLSLDASKLDYFYKHPGSYSVDIIQPFDPSPTWSVGVFVFRLGGPSATSSLDTTLTEAMVLSGDIYRPLPTISHTFRVDPKPPFALLTMVFTGLCLSPLVFLLPTWLFWVGVNMSALPVSSLSKMANALLFLAPFASFLVTIFFYWTSLNVFQALTILVPLAGVLVITTRNAIMDLSSNLNNY